MPRNRCAFSDLITLSHGAFFTERDHLTVKNVGEKSWDLGAGGQPCHLELLSLSDTFSF